MLRLRAFRRSSDKVVKIELHPTHPWLFTADASDRVSVWNWKHRQVIYEVKAGGVDERRLVGSKLEKLAEGESEPKGNGLGKYGTPVVNRFDWIYGRWRTVSDRRKWKKAFNEVSNQWRSRSYATSVPSQIPKSHKARKRVSKDERQAMVESYVNEYRGMHAGKFPSTKDAQKQVGGSFYVIRKIIQEIDHKSKILSSSGGNEDFLEEGLSIAIKLSTAEVKIVSQGVLQSSEKVEHEEAVKPIAPEIHSDTVKSQSNNLLGANAKDSSPPCPEKSEDHKVKEAQSDDNSDFVSTDTHLLQRQTVDSCLEKREGCKREKAQDGGSHFIAAESHMVKVETKNVSHPFQEKADDDRENLNGLMDDNLPKHKEGFAEMDKFEKDIPNRQSDDAELPKKSTLWGNLKSFADGIVNMWRKL